MENGKDEEEKANEKEVEKGKNEEEKKIYRN